MRVYEFSEATHYLLFDNKKEIEHKYSMIRAKLRNAQRFIAFSALCTVRQTFIVNYLYGQLVSIG